MHVAMSWPTGQRPTSLHWSGSAEPPLLALHVPGRESSELSWEALCMPAACGSVWKRGSTLLPRTQAVVVLTPTGAALRGCPQACTTPAGGDLG